MSPEPETSADIAARWRAAAARLVGVLRAADDEELRLSVLKRVARGFGEHGYPAFLKLLMIVADSHDHDARRLLASSLAVALRRADLPGGQLTSWGASRFWTLQQPFPADQLPGNVYGLAPRRQLGPLEYLTVWYCQRTQRPLLSEASFRLALCSLIRLIELDADARERYARKLQTDAEDEVEGTYTRTTRARLAAMAAAWRAGEPPEAIAAAAAIWAH